MFFIKHYEVIKFFSRCSYLSVLIKYVSRQRCVCVRLCLGLMTVWNFWSEVTMCVSDVFNLRLLNLQHVYTDTPSARTCSIMKTGPGSEEVKDRALERRDVSTMLL